MGTYNSERFDHARQFVDDRVDAFKSGMHKVLDRAFTRPDGMPSRMRVWSTAATEAVKAHPYIAVGAALGLGYAIVWLARR
jgi:hypothetical protein